MIFCQHLCRAINRTYNGGVEILSQKRQEVFANAIAQICPAIIRLIYYEWDVMGFKMAQDLLPGYTQERTDYVVVSHPRNSAESRKACTSDQPQQYFFCLVVSSMCCGNIRALSIGTYTFQKIVSEDPGSFLNSYALSISKGPDIAMFNGETESKIMGQFLNKTGIVSGFPAPEAVLKVGHLKAQLPLATQ
jgi:hypothetical protein